MDQGTEPALKQADRSQGAQYRLPGETEFQVTEDAQLPQTTGKNRDGQKRKGCPVLGFTKPKALDSEEENH